MLKLKFFGHFEVWLNDQAVPKDAWKQKKVKTLLQILMVRRPDVVTQDQLIDILFPDLVPDKAKRQLYSRISELRHLLEPNLDRGTDSQYVIRESQGYRFTESEQCRLDIEAFERAIREGNCFMEAESLSQARDCFQRACDLYRGPFLSEDLYEDWTIGHRDHYFEIYLKALEQLALCHIEHHQFDEAIGRCQHALTLAPDRESLFRILMRAHYYAGAESEALRVYKQCESTLARELGVTPSAETEKLFTQISSKSMPKHERVIPSNLPARITSFVGRKSELNEINTLLADPDCRLLTLLGLGGIGKTRLALEAGMEQIDRRRFKDGVYAVFLGDRSADEHLAQAMVFQLNLPFFGQSDPEAQLLNYLREKELLLVIDQLETWLDQVVLFDELLRAAPGIKILITSRERLKLKSEWICSIQGLSHRSDVDREKIEELDSTKLFLERIRQLNHQRPDAENLQSINDICQLLEGMPLGIELAAALTRTLSLEQIVRELKTNLSSISTQYQDVAERHQSIAAVFQQSWERLTAKEQAVFAKLSLFRSAFSSEAAMEVAEASPQLLSNLLDKSMIRQTSQRRFMIHALLKQFGDRLLRQDREMSHATEIAYADYYSDFLVKRSVALEDDRQLAVIDEIGSEFENIQKAWSWALVRGAFDQIDKMLSPVANYLYYKEHITLGESILSDAFKFLKRTGDATTLGGPYNRLYGRVMSYLGQFVAENGTYTTAIDLQTEALRIAEHWNDESLQAMSNIHIALGDVYLGHVESGRARLPQVEAAVESADDDRIRLMLLNKLGQIYAKLEDLPTMSDHFLRLIDLNQNIGNPYHYAYAHGFLGLAANINGHFEEAREHMEKCVRYGDFNKGILATAIINFGTIDYRLGNYVQAKEHMLKGIRLEMELGHDELLAGSYLHMIRLLIAMGEIAEAAQYLDRLTPIEERLENKITKGRIYTIIGAVRTAQGRYEEAEENLIVSEQILVSVKSHSHLGYTYTWLTHLKRLMGMLDESWKYLALAIESAVAAGIETNILRELLEAPALYECEGKFSDAVTLLTFLAGQSKLEPQFTPQISASLERLQARLTPQEYERAVKSAHGLHLKEVLESLPSGRLSATIHQP